MFVLYFIHQQRESRRLAPANLNNWVAMPRESRPIRDAHLDRLHRTLGLRSGPVEHAVIPDDCNFGGDRLLFRDRTFLRLRVLNDPIGLRCGREDETEVPRATVGSGRARSSRATARRGSPCHRRSIQASCGFMRRKRSEGEPQPMTLGQALAAKVRLLVWQEVLAPGRTRYSRSGRAIRCRHRRYRLGWALRCSACEGHEVDFVVSGARR
jgi:hypothetical protein